MADEHDFESGSSGASQTYPQQCSALRKNGHVLIKNRPCKIVDMSTSKTGKHGHAKVHLVAIDIFTGKRFEDICPSTHNMDVPHVNRKEYELMDLDEEGYFSLVADGQPLENLKYNDNCSQSLKEIQDMMAKCENDQYLVATVWSAMGEDMVKDVKMGKQ